MKHTFPLLHVVLIVVMLLSAAGCNLPVGPKPTVISQPTPTVTPIPTNTPNPLLVKLLGDKTPLVPKVIKNSSSVPSLGPIQVTFDHAMDQTATASAWSLTGPDGKAVAGALGWDNPTTLRFTPSQPLTNGAIYLAEIKTGAKTTEGAALEDSVRLKFDVSGDLKISQVFPVPGAIAVDNHSVITLLFNRPVVPLITAEDQSKLPNPLVLTPEVAGHGEWVNTSVFTFHPDQPLKSGTAYTAAVKAGLAAAAGGDGSVLAQDMTWNFTTVAPSVDFVQLGALDTSSGGKVGDNNNNNQPQVDIPLDATISVVFHQAMDPTSVELSLKVMTMDGKLAGEDLKWNKDHTIVQLTPREHLAYGTNYTISIPTTAQASGGGGLDKSLAWPFTTVLSPAILSTDPADRAKGDMKFNFTVRFASPMKMETLASRVVFNPPLKASTLPDDQRHYYNDFDHSLMFFGLEPSTTYQVTLQPGMADLYGKTIDSPTTISFSTGPQQPWANILMPYQAYYRTDGPKDFYAQYVNIDQVTFNLYKVPPEDLKTVMSDPTSGSFSKDLLVWSATDKSQGKLNEVVLKKMTLGDGNKTPLTPGIYMLASKSPSIPTNSSSPYFDIHLLVVASGNLTFKSSNGESLLWLTDLTSGKPLAGVSLQVYDNNFASLAKGTTDQNGMLRVILPQLGPNTYVSYAISDDPSHYALAALNWGSGVSPYQFGISEAYYSLPIPLKAYLYTERPVYRPGQPVYFKGILRIDDDLKYTLPDLNKVHVTIESYKDLVYDETLDLSAMGTFDGKFILDQNAALGPYTIKVLPPTPQTKDNEQIIASLNFSVAEYRRPDYTVAVDAQPANLLAGDKFTAYVAASYFSGGAVGGAKLSWTLNALPFSFTPPETYLPYTFSDIPLDTGDFYRPQQAPDSTVIAQGNGQTKDDGTFTVSLPASLDKNGNGQILTFEATLTDQSGNTVSGRANVTAHQSSVYVGVKPSDYVGSAGKESSFDLVVIDWRGTIQPGHKVDVDIIERQWFSVQKQDAQGNLTWDTSVKDVPVTSFKDQVAGTDGKLKVSFTPPHGGIYLARGTVLDDKGNTAHASAYIWAAGSDYIDWRQTNDRSFQLVVDQTSYKPGDTAQLLIASPFQGQAYALVTVERGHTRKAEVLQLTSNSTVYQLPITPDMAPNVFVDVTIIKGVDQTNPRPNFKVGMVKIKVATDAQAINVSLKPDKTSAGPGDKVTYQVQTTDSQGKGVKAEVSLGLSDLATLTLAAPNAGPLMDYFYGQRDLGVVTAVSIVSSAEEYNAQLTPTSPLGGRGGSGGGKGSGYLGVMEIRENFPDTAFWEAHLLTSDDGKATVSVTFPDNLTTWRMDARAVTQDTRVGQTTVDIVSTKPLLVLPQTPRFFVVGDSATLGAGIHNNTDQDMDISVTLTAQGITLDGSQTQSVKVAANRQGYVSWKGTVNPDVQRVDLVFGAASGDYRDASRPTVGTLDNGGIPVYRFTAEEVVGTSGQLTTGGARAEALDLPASWGVTQGSVVVEMQPSLAAGWTDGLTFLQNPLYASAEELISSFLPNVLTTQALKAAGLSNPDLEANLKQQVNQAVQRLSKQQRSDGGWGWWSNLESDPLVTAYIVQGLVEAKAAGYTVNEDSLARALGYLKQNLKTLQTLSPRQDLNRQAFILYVLALAGQPDPSHSVQLYDARQNLNLYARAYLAQTLKMIDPKDTRLDTLLSDLNSAAITSATGVHWEESFADTWNWNTDVRSTAIILDTLIQLNPGGDLNPNVVRWLMRSRVEGRWSSTQETAWVLIALTDWVKQTGELKAAYDYAATFNGQEIGSGTASADTIRKVTTLSLDVNNLLTDQANRLMIARTDGTGILYYTAHLNVNLPVEKISALDRGFTISRQYFASADLKTPVTTAKQGDVVLVRLTVVVPDERHFTMVDDPLPAGLEAVDTSLTNSQQTLTPAEYDWNKLSSEGYGWWFFDHIEIKDSKVVLSASYLPAGTYVYTYYARAVTVGSFQTIPPTAKEFYFPEVYGRGEGSMFEVKTP
jgi:uncharacterized protein YfaS (alpha-2-macroglobulin family)